MLEEETISETNFALAKNYLKQMKTLINAGQYFEFGNIRRDYGDLKSLMKKGGYFSSEQIRELDDEYNSFADPRVLVHLQENF